ncbi:hypothetical protein GF337_12055 [candidate division KSB1 bacterium]|nr:hypothetical protein [candidate division KSB1 bacterium]
MGYFESTVVVYLRELYFPEGFRFPIKFLPMKLSLIEIGREFSTMMMLLGLAFVGSKKRWTRFGIFMLCFGVWDIWYYIWLKVMLNWPQSLLTWDLLFLIPVPWAGPVLAPVLVSLVLIFAGVAIIILEDKNYKIKLFKSEWALVVLSGAIIFVSFILEAPEVMRLEAPSNYNWFLFWVGELIGVGVAVNALRRILATGKSS